MDVSKRMPEVCKLESSSLESDGFFNVQFGLVRDERASCFLQFIAQKVVLNEKVHYLYVFINNIHPFN